MATSLQNRVIGAYESVVDRGVSVRVLALVTLAAAAVGIAIGFGMSQLTGTGESTGMSSILNSVEPSDGQVPEQGGR